MTIHMLQNPEQVFSANYSQLDVRFDNEQSALWFHMHAEPRPCFTPTLLTELDGLFNKLQSHPGNSHPVKYLIAASAVDEIYNLGGDLDTFARHIETANESALREYAYACLELGYKCTTQFNHDITTIALIQGAALGGGFEAALSCNVIVAEEGCKIGFPEILFNLFPGMGAYTYLSRRIPMHLADQIITSGRQYLAEELYELGAIEVLAKKGQGVKAVHEFIEEHAHQRRGRNAMHKARLRANPITLEELQDIADIWVEAAMQTDQKALNIMRRFVRAQTKKVETHKSGVA